MKYSRAFIIFMLVLFVALSGCTVCRKSVDLHKGTIKKNIKICSKPTKAMIYINEKPIGKTPFKTKLEYGSNHLVNIKAVPLYPNQYTQNIYLSIPPVPKKMTIIMTQKPVDHKPKAVSVELPPAKPSRAVITRVDTSKGTQVTKTIVDTVFVQQTHVEEKIIVPPIVYFDSNEVKPYNYESLDEFINLMKDKLDIMIDIYGYADSREDAKTMPLSRAKAIFNYMVKSGVEPSRMHVFGTAGTMQTAMGKEAADPALARKVMFQLYYEDNK